MVQSSIQHFHFQEYKIALPSYFTDQGKPARSWEFQEPLVFKRFDSFVERLHTMLEFFSTAVQVRNFSRKKSLSSFEKFMKLEKVEIGGIRGKALTSNIGKVYEEFKVKPFLMKASIPLPKRQHFNDKNSNQRYIHQRNLLNRSI